MPAVADTVRARFAELVAPTPGRAAFALRIAAICCLTALVTQTYDLPSQAIAAYVPFFFNKPDRLSTVLTSVVFAVVISIVIGLLLIVASAVLDQPALRVATMATLSLGLLFVGAASKLKPLAPTIALIAAYALDVIGQVSEGELAVRGLLYAWLAIAIPAGLSIVVALIAAPSPRHLAARAVALRLRLAAALLDGPSARVQKDAAAARRAGTSPALALVGLAAKEPGAAAADIAALRQSVLSAGTLLALTEAVAGTADVPPAWRAEAARLLRRMATMFDRDNYPLDIGQPLAAGSRPAGAVLDLVTDCEQVLATFAEPPPAPVTAAPATAHRGFLVPDAFTNPDHVRHAVKVTGAAMACYLFYSLADWPGIHTCLITCYVVGLGTTAETVEKLVLRLIGCLVGAALGIAAIVWVVPHLDSVGGLLALVFAGGLLGSWIAVGSPRIGYAGFQIAFAFFVCVLQGPAPAFDLTVARDRVVGILLGNIAVFAVFTAVWPVSIVARIDPALIALLRQFGRIARLPGRSARRMALPTAHAASAAVAGDLDIARYEPRSLRPAAAWFKPRQSTMAELSTIEATLMMVDDDDRLADIASRLDQLAAALAAGQTAGVHGKAAGIDGVSERVAREAVDA